MHQGLFCFTVRSASLSLPPSSSFLRLHTAGHHCRTLSFIPRYTLMDAGNSPLIAKNSLAQFRYCNVSGFKTELIEIRANKPTLHILFIPGNPGVVSFYTDFLEYLYELLRGTTSITAISHISHSGKNWEHGRLFSLEEQINHKLDFIKNELQDNEVPLLLLGHSIGSYISIEMFRRSPEKVTYCIGLYPFLAVDPKSAQQSAIKKIVESPIMCSLVSSLVAFIGLLPRRASKFLILKSIGRSWSSTAIEALCNHLLQYHTVRNVLFLAMTEFQKLSEEPDWEFMKRKQRQLAFLFGADDHWGPLHLLDEISKHVPGAAVAVEREGHTHAFSCTKAGSLWVAQHVASYIVKFQGKQTSD
ncbi:lipid droplet-associated hydrolase isoform X2 [Impatiens glandulifera]|uniref:lipid droplet-associated hydrolase isoform X2 n=1 Tax=Impatiens glandulifera TaxID=253017 RepID=UPI001FB114AD|nr:lipid droplet-associated hydrolase isoform X2 [Impatiens glandulifera]